ncbi:MAG TPA: hypothetical protein VF762_23295 [Blastocatellia bacterium]|jgi:hypothetical protein
MKRFVSVLLSVAFMLCLGAASMARTRGIDGRERCEQRRIRQGVRSGELTRREAERLSAEQFRIRAYEARARSDGSLTRRERYRLDHMLDRASRDIYRQKHDDQDRDR